jgi:Glucose / Sorbosone dehydrogenase
MSGAESAALFPAADRRTADKRSLCVRNLRCSDLMGETRPRENGSETRRLAVVAVGPRCRLGQSQIGLSPIQQTDIGTAQQLVRTLQPFRLRLALWVRSSLWQLLCVPVLWICTSGTVAAEYDWQEDWIVQPGFSLDVDTAGYKFPTSIAFVPDPGTHAKDPLYFVGELRGTIKVVTNDRSVYTFAEDFFQSIPPKELPAGEGAVGLFGLCLAPDHGFVYATFARLRSDGLFENGMVRFDTTPQVFSIQQKRAVEFSPALSSPRSHFGPPFGHQIGACQVYDEHLFVSVGDGEIPNRSQDLDSTLGKILRMTLDGRPVPQNPFYTDDFVIDDNDFIWAYGLRNPFGHVVVKGRVFVADNGPRPDRFLEAIQGGNYLYDGSDDSIATNSIVVFQAGRGLGHVVYGGEEATDFLPERLRFSFFVALSGALERFSERERPEIVALNYKLDAHLLLRRPEAVLRYNGSEPQSLAGIALGQDGLYFAPVMPDPSGTTAVYKLSYDSKNKHPFVIAERLDALYLMGEYGCFGCHKLRGQGANRAPSLDSENLIRSIKMKLDSAEYAEQIRSLDGRKEALYSEFASARKEIMDAEDSEKIRKWLIYRIIEPRFDDPDASMPNLGVSHAEAEVIADYLLVGSSNPSLKGVLTDLVPRPGRRHLVYFFVAGLVGGGAITIAVIGIVRLTWGPSGRRSAPGGVSTGS